MRSSVSLAIAVGALALLAGCGRYPNPLNPAIRGSIGTTSHGVLTHGAALENKEHVKLLRTNGRHWGIPRFVAAIERAATAVAGARPGAPLYVGDISARHGGKLSHHGSHTSGRDADLLLYVTTLDGVPVRSPGFISFDADGLAWDSSRGQYVRFDVEREWLLIKTLIEDPEARVQWIFIHEVLEAIVLEYALARGDSAETIWRAQEMMLRSGGPHDDHIHVRTECSYEDLVSGCERTGLSRPWIREQAPQPDDTRELVMAILRPLNEAASAVSSNP